MQSRVAAIDIGTNTIRLLIADLDQTDQFRKVLTKRRVTRLGEDFIEKSRISCRAIERSISVIQEFLEMTKEHRVERVIAGATSAVRDAANGDDFIKKVYEDTGLRIKVLSGKEEAILTLAGVLSVIKGIASQALVMDIGGGSTELIVVEAGTPISAHSLDLGAVYLSERFLKTDPPTAQALKKMEASIFNRLTFFKEDVLDRRPGPSSYSLIGTAGTITTLAAMDQQMMVYDPDKINKHILSRESVKAIYHRLIGIPVVERSLLPGLEKGREDIILAGTCIVVTAMEVFHCHEMVVSDYGLLEGMLMRHS